MEAPPPPPPPSRKSWSIHTRTEITDRYEILERIGSGTYSDVYRGRRVSDGLIVALKEIHDYQSAFREIEALQTLQNSPNIISLLDYFWREDDDEDAVLVLEFLQSDLASVVCHAKRNRADGIPAGEIKRWMVQILQAVDSCHRNSVVHRDLKPSNLLISAEGVLKLADFGQSRIHFLEPKFLSREDNPHVQYPQQQTWTPQQPEIIANPEAESSLLDSSGNQSASIQEPKLLHENHLRELDDYEVKDLANESEKDAKFPDGDTSCLATCTTSDMEDDPLKSSYSYEAAVGEDESGALTSCVGTRWFRAPELLYGSTNYGLEIDLWSLGCILAELLRLEPLFPGTSDIDQLSRIINVLGDINEETWPGCSKLPDFGKISFNNVENSLGLETCLRNCSSTEISLVKRLISYDPMNRATAMELLHDRYFSDEPLPVPITELSVPSRSNEPDESSRGDWCDYRDFESDSDLEFGGVDVSTTDEGFAIRFS